MPVVFSNEVSKKIIKVAHDVFSDVDYKDIAPNLNYPDFSDDGTQMCAYLKSDKRRTNFITIKYLEDRKLVAFIKSCNKYYSMNPSSSIPKYILCFIMFVAQNISSFTLPFEDYFKQFQGNEEDKEFFHVLINIMMKYEREDMSGQAAISEFEDLIVVGTDEKDQEDKEDEQSPPAEDETSKIMSYILNKKWDHVKLQSIFDLNLLDNNIVFQALQEYVELKMIPDFYDIKKNKVILSKSKNKTKLFKKTLQFLNPARCIHHDEDHIMASTIKDYTLDDLDNFSNVGGYGYCFTYYDIASFLIMNKGYIHADLKNMEYGDELAEKIAIFFMGNTSIRKEERADILRKISDLKKDVISLKVLDSTSSISEWYAYFSYLQSNEFSLSLKLSNVERVYSSSCGSIFGLIGLFGYITYSDDLTNAELNDSGSFFKISEACSTILVQFFSDLNALDPELYADIKKVEFRKRNIESIFEAIGNTCVHGIGIACMQFYIQAMEASLQYSKLMLENIKKEFDQNHEKKHEHIVSMLGQYHLHKFGLDIEDTSLSFERVKDFVNDIYKVHPFFIETPQKFFSDTGYKYLTCACFDKMNRPNDRIYSIVGYEPSGKSKRLFYMECVGFEYPPNSSTSALDWFNVSNVTPKVVQDGDVPVYMLLDHPALMTKLARIPYVFQRTRVPMFKLYKEYTLNLCGILKQDITHNDRLNKLREYSSKSSNTFDQSVVSPKYLSVINLEPIEPPSKKLAHMYNNAQGKKIYEQPYALPAWNKGIYICPLEDIIRLQYQVTDQTNPAAIIKIHEYNANITRPYQYGRILGGMLYDDIHWQHVQRLEMSPLTNIGNIKEKWGLFENYYLNLHGQASNLRSTIFSTLSLNVSGRIITINDLDMENETIGELFGDVSIENFKKLASIWRTIDTINCPEKVDKLLKLLKVTKKNKENKLSDALNHLLIDIISRMNALMMVLMIYYKTVMPSNRQDKYNRLWNFNVRRAEHRGVWLQPYNFDNFESMNTEKFYDDLILNYYKMLTSLIEIQIPYSSTSQDQLQSTLMYHFTEIKSEI